MAPEARLDLLHLLLAVPRSGRVLPVLKALSAAGVEEETVAPREASDANEVQLPGFARPAAPGVQVQLATGIGESYRLARQIPEAEQWFRRALALGGEDSQAVQAGLVSRIADLHAEAARRKENDLRRPVLRRELGPPLTADPSTMAPVRSRLIASVPSSVKELR